METEGTQNEITVEATAAPVMAESTSTDIPGPTEAELAAASAALAPEQAAPAATPLEPRAPANDPGRSLAVAAPNAAANAAPAVTDTPLPPELAGLGMFKTAGDVRNYLVFQEQDRAKQAQALQALQQQIQQLQAKPAQPAAPPAPPKPTYARKPRNLEEAFPGRWTPEQYKTLTNAEIMDAWDEWRLDNSPEHVDRLRSKLLGDNMKKYDDFIAGFQQNAQTQQQQQAAAQQQQQFFQYIGGQEQAFYSANPTLKADPAFNAFMKDNAPMLLASLRSVPNFNPYEYAKKYVAPMALANARVGAATARARQTGALAQTSRPGASALTVPAAGASEESKIRHSVIAAGGSEADADAAVRSAQHYSLADAM